MIKLNGFFDAPSRKRIEYIYVGFHHESPEKIQLPKGLPYKGKDIIRKDLLYKDQDLTKSTEVKDLLENRGYIFEVLKEEELKKDQEMACMNYSNLKQMLNSDEIEELAKIVFPGSTRPLLNLKRVLDGGFEFNSEKLFRFTQALSISTDDFFFYNTAAMGVSFTGVFIDEMISLAMYKKTNREHSYTRIKLMRGNRTIDYFDTDIKSQNDSPFAYTYDYCKKGEGEDQITREELIEQQATYLNIREQISDLRKDMERSRDTYEKDLEVQKEKYKKDLSDQRQQFFELTKELKKNYKNELKKLTKTKSYDKENTE